MEPEFYSFAQSDKDGAMGDKDLSPREEYFAVTFTSQPPKVKPIILTVPQAATSAFSIQKNFAASQAETATLNTMELSFLSLLQLALKETRRQKNPWRVFNMSSLLLNFKTPIIWDKLHIFMKLYSLKP